MYSFLESSIVFSVNQSRLKHESLLNGEASLKCIPQEDYTFTFPLAQSEHHEVLIFEQALEYCGDG